eukprot:COSAG03_NODE_456_length_7759_cov_122.878068_2_plen_73_part_00
MRSIDLHSPLFSLGPHLRCLIRADRLELVVRLVGRHGLLHARCGSSLASLSQLLPFQIYRTGSTVTGAWPQM